MPKIAAVGAASVTTFTPETAFGVVGAAPVMKILRSKGAPKFEFKPDTLESKEASATRQVMGLTFGNASGTGDIPFELSYGSFDDILEAVFGGTWTANVLKIGQVKRSFACEQQWPDINLYEQNYGIVFNSFGIGVKPNAIVEGSFGFTFKDQKSIQTIADDVQTMAFAATTITRSAGSFVTEGYAIGDSVMVAGGSVAGNNKIVILTAVSALILTAAAAGFTVDAAKTGVSLCKTLGAATAVNANSVFDSFTGVISEAGVTSAIVTGIDVKLDQSASGSNILFDKTIQQVSLGTVRVTGTIVVRFINNAMKAKFLAGSSTDISFTLGVTNKTYKFDMSSAKFTSASTDNGDSELTQSFGYTAIYDAGDASSLMCTRTP
jgi:hypothetical protein